MSEGVNPIYTSDIRFTDKGLNSNERDNFYGYFKEQINLYGQKTEYFIHNYALSAHDAIYGEQPSATYSDGIEFVMFVELNEQSILLGQFGLTGDDEVTAYVPISGFYDTFGPGKEPKSGDVFTLTEYGDDRPGDRAGKSFEITQRLDQEVGSDINPLMGHYVWFLKAKRLDYTFEPGLTAERGADQVYDGSFAGRLSRYTNPKTDNKV